MMPGGEDVNTTLPLILNIVATLFCCLPVGVVGIIFAVQAGAAKTAGDWESARTKAKTSLIIALACMALGIVGGIAYFILMVAGAAAGSH